MGYEFGLTNYILHELGSNMIDRDTLLKNEELCFDSDLSEEDRIIVEINKIKNVTNEYNNLLSNSFINIKEAIVCIDLLLEIEVSFKRDFINIITYILDNNEINNLLDLEFVSYDETLKKSDELFEKLIYDYLTNKC